MAKKTLEDQINGFLEMWDMDRQVAFLRDILPLFELFDVDDERDWVVDAVGEENQVHFRLLRTVYIMSVIAEKHAGRLASIRCNFPDLHKKMELILAEVKDEQVI